MTVNTRSFPCEVGSARAARHYVADVLAGPELEAAREPLSGDAAIVITELAANAVLHARSAFTVTVARSAGGVRIEVRDYADGSLQVSPGHGLSVVAQLAARWGVEPGAGGKVVWAELPAAPRPAGSGARPGVRLVS